MGVELYEAEDGLNLAFAAFFGAWQCDFGEVELVQH